MFTNFPKCPPLIIKWISPQSYQGLSESDSELYIHFEFFEEIHNHFKKHINLPSQATYVGNFF